MATWAKVSTGQCAREIGRWSPLGTDKDKQVSSTPHRLNKDMGDKQISNKQYHIWCVNQESVRESK